MSFDIKAAIHKPWVKYGLLAIGFLGVVYIIHARESSTTTTTDSSGPTDAEVAADAQLQGAQIQAGAAAASQDSAQNFQLAQQSEADKTNLSAQGASIAGQLALASNNNTTSVSLANIQLQGLQAQLNEASHVNDNLTATYINGQNQTAGVARNGQVQAKQGQTIATVGTIVVAAIAAFF